MPFPSGKRDYPCWKNDIVKMKTLDLHKFETEDEAVKAVRHVLNSKCFKEEAAWEIVCGAGSHTEVTKHGRIATETGDWKNKQEPLFFTVKKLVQEASGKCRSWIPADKDGSTIYVRAEVVQTESRPSPSDYRDASEIFAAADSAEDKLRRHNQSVSAAVREREDAHLKEFAALKLKQESGAKMSNKDRREFEKLQKRCEDIEKERVQDTQARADRLDGSDVSASEDEVDECGNTIRKR